jgi:Zn-dependent M28 family amino/carboxypeptidase
MEDDVRAISIPRPSNTDSNQQVRSYIKKELVSAGLAVTEDKFSGGTNIVGTLKGTSGRTIIVGSHYDSVDSTPGADDNASGCALNLATARALSRTRTTHTLVFLFFDSEEYGLVGSSSYAKTAYSTCDFMVNLDMVGHLSTQVVGPIPPSLFEKYPWAESISYQNAGRMSDHSPFTDRGVPTVWVFTGTHPRYHRPSDTPDTLNYAGMRLIARYVTDMVTTFDSTPANTYVKSLRPMDPLY